jgi:hypothetical protein
MNLQVQRTDFTDQSTIGELSIDGKFEGYTLEEPGRPRKIRDVTAIPTGTYRVEITFSEHFQKPMPIAHGCPEFQRRPHSRWQPPKRHERLHSCRPAEGEEPDSKQQNRLRCPIR